MAWLLVADVPSVLAECFLRGSRPRPRLGQSGSSSSSAGVACDVARRLPHVVLPGLHRPVWLHRPLPSLCLLLSWASVSSLGAVALRHPRRRRPWLLSSLDALWCLRGVVRAGIGPLLVADVNLRLVRCRWLPGFWWVAGG